VADPARKHEPEPLTRDEVEACYFALIDLLTSNFPIDEARRARLKALVGRLSDHARYLEVLKRTQSGLRKKVDPVERRALIRQKLLVRRPAEEKGTWAIYAEGVSDDPRELLLAVAQGTYAEAIERALTEPGFITEGMGGQIDLLGIPEVK
jgi:hypothetical protein